ncbi:MAG: hypothetical protein ACRD2R_00045, partial [Terriglobales bacterium]
LEVLRVGPEWKQILEKHGVEWVLAGTESALAGALRESAGWRLAYQDPTAVVFGRVQARAAAPAAKEER